MGKQDEETGDRRGEAGGGRRGLRMGGKLRGRTSVERTRTFMPDVYGAREGFDRGPVRVVLKWEQLDVLVRLARAAQIITCEGKEVQRACVIWEGRVRVGSRTIIPREEALASLLRGDEEEVDLDGVCGEERCRLRSELCAHGVTIHKQARGRIGTVRTVCDHFEVVRDA